MPSIKKICENCGMNCKNFKLHRCLSKEDIENLKIDFYENLLGYRELYKKYNTTIIGRFLNQSEPEFYECKICGYFCKKRNGLALHKKSGACKIIDEEKIINDYVENHFSLIQIIDKYNCTSHQLDFIFNKNNVERRNSKEAAKFVLEKFPNCKIKTDEQKENMRKSHMKLINSRSGITAFERRNSKKMSYLEEWFYNEVIVKNNLTEKYDIINELMIYPYSIDFAFVNIKLAVELDGGFHEREEAKIHDAKRDEIIISNGWKIYRIKSSQQCQETIQEFLNFLDTINNFEPKVYRCEVIKYKEIQITKGMIKELKNEMNKMLHRNEIMKLKKAILNSKIDFSRICWEEDVYAEFHVDGRWVKRHLPQLHEKAARRKKGIKNPINHNINEKIEIINKLDPFSPNILQNVNKILDVVPSTGRYWLAKYMPDFFDKTKSRK